MVGWVMTEPYRFSGGRTPLLVSIPHVGTAVPEPIAARMTDTACRLPDTDWHVDRLYNFLSDVGASVIAATYSRYVVDLNRAPDNRPLYPGSGETGLCPITTFADQPIYRDRQAPDETEVAERRELYWRPYHERLRGELAAIRERHGAALLWEAHSIRSRVPRFFAGTLPDLNFGSGGGATADPDLVARLAEVAAAAENYRHVVDDRFKGGYITRAYGKPDAGAHAVQLELAQSTYMEEDPPYTFREDLADRIRLVLRRLLETAVQWLRDAARAS